MRFGGLVAAIVFAAVMAVIVLKMSSNQTPAPATQAAAPAIESVNIYVATQPIPIGSTISEAMVTTQAWPRNLMLEGFMRADGKQSPIGMVARSPFQVQEPILSSKVANAQDPNFLAGALPKGMRIITIQTNEIEGLAGFVFPGDRVDVLLTHKVENWVQDPAAPGQMASPRRVEKAVTETLLTNVTVVAVDQRASGANNVNEKGTLIVPRSVSLMVSPIDAQRLRLGAQEGTLTLSLRSLEDRESSDPLVITGMSDISQFTGSTMDADAQVGDNVLVIRGTEAKTSASKSKTAPAAAPAASFNPNMPIAASGGEAMITR